MKPTGIRQVLAEQGTEGAIIYLATMVEEMYALYVKSKAPAAPPEAEAPKEEV